MTAEKRITIEPADISTLELECSRCGSIQAIPLAKLDSISHACPNCRQEWFQRGGPEEVALGEFIDAFKTLQRLSLKAKLRFHLKDANAAL